MFELFTLGMIETPVVARRVSDLKRRRPDAKLKSAEDFMNTRIKLKTDWTTR
jgi:hypothetical protein